MIDTYMDRFEHPYLFTLVPVAGLLLVLGVIVDVTGIAGPRYTNFIAGFLALYAVVALIICALGYVALYSISFTTEALRQWRIDRSELE
ncbi:hypothetical protein AB7C87_04865 [Natrarchaeobius sp. A-rgal3]|uniref:hypothetical protein n=1 Tax=Natrarchaeobius versutus TaxID=1679078 RepID=UPI00350E9324